MQITKLEIPIPIIINGANLILLSVAPNYEYVDNKKTDNLLGYKYTVVEDITFEKFVVKVPSSTPVMTQEQIDTAKDRIYVTFNNAIAKPYRNTSTGNYDLSINANGISIVK